MLCIPGRSLKDSHPNEGDYLKSSFETLNLICKGRGRAGVECE